MKITRDNYESFFLDYLEGNLEESIIDQFLDFLEQHPDLKKELQLFENIRLPEEPVSFAGKKHLYKSPADEKEAFELKAIAWMEGDLKDEERCGFEAYLAQHPVLKKEAALMENTRLTADTGIRYPDKHKLYKASGTVVLMNWVARAAAILVLLWGISTFFESEKQGISPTQPKEVAAVKVPLAPAPPQEAPAVSDQTKADQTAGIVASKKVEPARVNDQKATTDHKAEISESTPSPAGREVQPMDEIHPLMVSLEREPVEAELAVSRAYDTEKINGPGNVMSLDEYLASRAKKATSEGLLSAHRILRVGLNVASELTGDRIGYTVKKGKVATVDFESRLLAFSIPLEKK